jgi:hypothetical protein
MSTRLSLGFVLVGILLVGCGPGAAASVEATLSPTPSPPAIATAAPASAPAPPSPSPVAEATVPVDWATYTSPKYAYSIDYPTDWTTTPASQDWPATGFSYPDDPAIDKWVMPPGDSWVLMFVSSVPLKAGETATQRIARLDTDNAQAPCQLGHRTDVTVDGKTARQEDGTCFGSDYIREVAAVNNGRFYLIYILSGSPLTDTGLATFDHFLGSFKFG